MLAIARNLPSCSRSQVLGTRIGKFNVTRLFKQTQYSKPTLLNTSTINNITRRLLHTTNHNHKNPNNDQLRNNSGPTLVSFGDNKLRTFSLPGDAKVIGRDMPFKSIPVIDMGPFANPSSSLAERQKVAYEIGEACEHVGFFLVVNHGVSLDLIGDMMAQSKTFFALPMDVKSSLSMAEAGAIRGYFAVGEENLHEEGYTTAIDVKEGFDVGFDECAADFPHFPQHTMLNRFTPHMDASLVLRYRDALAHLGRRMASAFALSLDLPESHFDSMFQQPMATLRQLHYPPDPNTSSHSSADSSSSSSTADIVRYMDTHHDDELNHPGPVPPTADKHTPARLGCGAHTDYGCCTLLYQDNTGGLQARNSAGEWVDVPYVEGSFVVNIGDMMQRWTNGRFRSTVHRVRSNPSLDRFSVPFFFNPNARVVIECLSTCWSESNPKKFEPDTCGNILMGRYAPTMQHLGKDKVAK